MAAVQKSKQSLATVTIVNKYKILKDLDGGQSCIPVAKKYGMAKKSFTLLEKKAEILKQMKEAERRVSKKRKRIKTATYKELDSGMYK